MSHYDDQRDDRGYGDERGGRPRRGLPLSELDPALTDVSRRLIGCAIEVHTELGPGFDPEVYAKALKLELKDEGIAFKAGHTFEVRYGDDVVGSSTADLFVADRFAVKLMARTVQPAPPPAGRGPSRRDGNKVDRYSGEVTALRALLRAADLELGLIVNFGERRLKDGLVRVLNPDKLNAMRGDSDDYEDSGDGDDRD